MEETRWVLQVSRFRLLRSLGFGDRWVKVPLSEYRGGVVYR